MPHTAQETFARLVKAHLGPRLRRLGMTGSGNRWTLPSDTHWVLMGLQRSTTSTSQEVRFTLNLLVVRRDHWSAYVAEEPWAGDKPNPNESSGPGVWTTRIGQLLPPDRPGWGRGDRWWELHPTSDLDELASAVADVVEHVALPALRDEVTKT